MPTSDINGFAMSYRDTGGPASPVVLTVEIEDSVRRSDPRAPGPGGVGLRKK